MYMSTYLTGWPICTCKLYITKCFLGHWTTRVRFRPRQNALDQGNTCSLDTRCRSWLAKTNQTIGNGWDRLAASWCLWFATVCYFFSGCILVHPYMNVYAPEIERGFHAGWLVILKMLPFFKLYQRHVVGGAVLYGVISRQRWHGAGVEDHTQVFASDFFEIIAIFWKQNKLHAA